MGVPFPTRTFCSLLEVEEFVEDNPDLMNTRIAITGVHVQDIFDLADLLSRKEWQSGWEVQHLDMICGEGRKFALFVDDFEYLVDEAIKCIDDKEPITVNLGESLKKEAVRFLELAKGNNSFRFFIGFAQFMVHVSDDAIGASAIPDGEEESGTDGEGYYDGDEEEEDDDDEEGAEQAVQDQSPRFVRLRDKLVQVKAALKQLAAVRLVFPPPEQHPVQYSELADFVHSFPVEPEPEPVVLPALEAESLPEPAQPEASGGHTAPEE